VAYFWITRNKEGDEPLGVPASHPASDESPPEESAAEEPDKASQEDQEDQEDQEARPR
jgi:hypothetical protein